MYLSISQDIYKVLDDVLGQGAHTTVKSCVKLTTNQEYAVKVRKLSCGDRLLPPDFPFKLSSVMLLWKISILLPQVHVPMSSLRKFHFYQPFKSAYKPSDSSGQSLSWCQQHEVTRSNSSFLWMGCQSITGLASALNLPVPIYTPGWREAL